MFKVYNEYSNANISRTIRFTDKLFTQLSRCATDNHISFNLLVLQCCKNAMDDSEYKDIGSE